MKLTKQQKVLAAVVAAGVSLVVIDRLVLSQSVSGPKQASAAPAAVSAAANGAAAAAAEKPKPDDDAAQETADRAQQRALLAGHAELATRLDALAAQRDLSVAQMPEALMPAGPWARAETKVDSTPQEFVDFQDEYRLEAVIATDAGGGLAVVNGRMVRVGDLVAGRELVSVSSDRALFRYHGKEIELTLATDR